MFVSETVLLYETLERWRCYADVDSVVNNQDAATKTGGLPEIEFGGPDESATVWVKVFQVIDLPESSSSSQDRPHGQSPVKRVLSHVVWYHLDLVRLSHAMWRTHIDSTDSLIFGLVK